MKRFLPALIVAFSAGVADAEDADWWRAPPPLWEVGVGAFALTAPAYPASDQNSVNALPVPIAIYRGEVLRAGDGDAIAARALRTDRFTLDVGLNAAFPADSDDIDARRGMPDLDWIGEIGPQLEMRLSPADSRGRLTATLDARAVFTSDFEESFDYVGFKINPSLNYSEGAIFDDRGELFLSLGAEFGFDGANAYFYQVDPQFATASRAAFDAKNGYVGVDATLGASYRITRSLSAFGFGGVGIQQGAANADSPLFRDALNLSAGFGLTWSFLRSDRPAAGR